MPHHIKATTKVVTDQELAKHNKSGDAWLNIDGNVYDVSKFAGMHPGGEHLLLEYAGKDCSEVFWGLHRSEVLAKYQRLVIGRMEAAGEIDEDDLIQSPDDFSAVPYAEPSWVRGRFSPYYNDSHLEYRHAIRKFVHEELREEAEAGELSNKPPSKNAFLKMGAFGLLAARIGPGPHLKYVPTLPGGVSPEDFTYFHEGIAHEEMARLGCPGYADGLGAGFTIGMPPVLNFGPEWMREKVGREVLSGDKRIALAISEAFAGSDVAGLLTRGTKTADGKKFIVNGTKKWITGGCEADYFVTAVRTGGKGAGGVSLMLISREDSGDAFETKRIKTSYASSAGTAYITMENVEVPVENLLGQENQGFVCIMYNFNHERWMICCYALAGARGVIEECFKWATQRKVFGKALVQQPIIRWKLARMVSEMEAHTNWLEHLTHQMCEMSYEEAAFELAGDVSLLKFSSTRVCTLVADEAVQIFGGRGITATGMGRAVERFQRSYKFGSILGGSEEIMADLGIKMALKKYPENARL
eukprot:TRINITY_DN12999_c0_g1_i2.p1 TRINITY_DN12999_c0_g1~~TRINITY_DN12999_c0_g1_i2.p1  ORF type:complete len:528 (-),score=175.28 TRINITY_DN12999_c0_g1_i2:163-1746(-)